MVKKTNLKLSNLLEQGFTLLELLVVLAILGLLGGLVGPKVMDQFARAKPKTARIQMEDLAASLDMYRLDVGRYPTTEEGLIALIEPPADVSNWTGPYLRKKKLPKDPWNYDYHYQSPGAHGEFDIFSYGRDNQEGGEGEDKDLKSWE